MARAHGTPRLFTRVATAPSMSVTVVIEHMHVRFNYLVIYDTRRQQLLERDVDEQEALLDP